MHNLSQDAADAAIVYDYRTLMGALLERKRQLSLTNLDVEARGGFPSGYADKLFNGARKPGLILLGRLLDALEARILVVPAGKLDMAKLEKIAIARPHLDERGKDIRLVRWGRKGGIKRRCLLTPARRRAIAKLGGLARAAKARVEKERLAARAAPSALLPQLGRGQARGRAGGRSAPLPVHTCTPSEGRAARGIAPAVSQSD